MLQPNKRIPTPDEVLGEKKIPTPQEILGDDLKKKNQKSKDTSPGKKSELEPNDGLSDTPKFRLAGEKPVAQKNETELRNDLYGAPQDNSNSNYKVAKTTYINPATGKEMKGPVGDFLDAKKEREKELTSSFKTATKISPEEDEAIKKRISDEVNNRGILNGIETGLKRTWNGFMDVIGFGADESTKDAWKLSTNPLEDHIKDVKIEAAKNKEKLSEQEIKIRAEKKYLDSERLNVYVDKANSFLDNLSQEDKKVLELDRYEDIKNLNDSTKRKLNVQSVLKADFSEKYQAYKEIQSKIDTAKKSGQQIPEDIISDGMNLLNELQQINNTAQLNYQSLLKDKSDLGTAEQEFDLFRRENRDWANLGKTIGISAGEIGVGFLNFLEYLGTLGGNIGDDKTNKDVLKSISGLGSKLDKEREFLRKPVESIESVEGFVNYATDLVGNQLPILAATSTGAGGLALIGASSTGQKYAEMNEEVLQGKANYTPMQMAIAPFLYGGAEVISEIPTYSILKNGSRVLKAAENTAPELIKKSAKDKAIEWAKDYGIDMSKELAGEEFTQFTQNFTDKYVLGKANVGLLDNTGKVFKDTFTLTSILETAPHVAGAIVKPFQSKEDLALLDENSRKIIEFSKNLEMDDLTDSDRAVIQKQIEKLTSSSSKIMAKTIDKIGTMPDELFEEVKFLNKKAGEIKAQAREIDLNSKLKNKSELIKALEEEYKDIYDKRQNILLGRTSVVDVLPIPEQDKLKRQAMEDLVTELNPDGSKNIEITNEMVVNRANEIYAQSKSNEKEGNYPQKDNKVQENNIKTEGISPQTNITTNEGQTSGTDNADGNIRVSDNTEAIPTQNNDVQSTADSGITPELVGPKEITVGKYNYKFENGDWVATDKDGNAKAETKGKAIPSKVFEIHAENFDFTNGKSAIENFLVEYDSYAEDVAKNSENPAEIAETLSWVKVSDAKDGLDFKSVAIAEALGEKGVEPSSFNRFGDRNTINRSIALKYFSKKGQGRGIDEIAMSAEIEAYGDYNANAPRISEQDVIDFINENPSGALSFLNGGKRAKIDALKQAFTKATGLPATEKYLKKAIDQLTEKKERFQNEELLYQYTDEELLSLMNDYEKFQQQETNQTIPVRESGDSIQNPQASGFESGLQETRGEPAGREGEKSKSQREQVKDAIGNEAKSIKEIAEQTGILEPNVRRILGVGAKDGTFERVDKGVYVLKTSDGKQTAWIEAGDAVETTERMAKEGRKFDMVFLDPAYFSRALIGGNRGIKQYDFIMPDAFAKLMKNVSTMVDDDNHVYVMLSGAATAQNDMQKYVDGVIDAGFKVIGEGGYQKTFKDGSPVTNVRGEVAKPERLILVTKSGNAREGEIPVNLNFRFIRPSVKNSYQTEKPKELLRALIQQSTFEGEEILDPFAGSGVTGEQAIETGRSVTLIEKNPDVAENIVKPRVENAVNNKGTINKSSSLEDIKKWLDQAENDLDQFGKENLSMGIPIVVAKAAIKAMKLAVARLEDAAAIIQAGIDAVKQTDWYKNLTTTEQQDFEQNFERDFLGKISDIQFGIGSRQTENLLNRAVSESISEDDAYDEVKDTFDKARKELANKKTPKEIIREQYRKFISRFTDRQYLAKRLLGNSGLKNTKNLIINAHGASGKAKILFEDAYDKIYRKLTVKERNILDEIIQAKRFIAIDKNRESRGLDPVTHPNFIDGIKSEKFLSKLEEELGSDKFNDLSNRADEYFKVYKSLLKDMLDNGLISQASFDSLQDVDYQPRVFLQFVTDFDGDLDAGNRTNNNDTGGLSADQIKSMSEGDANSLVLNSEWLLTNSLLARTKAMAKNNINKRFITDEFPKAKQRFDSLDQNNLTGDDIRFYKYFKELSSKVIDNPIVGFTQNGNPKYEIEKTPLNFAKMYYYVDGQRNEFFVEKDLHESWNDNIDGFLSNQAKEFISYASGSALVKGIATGNNPAFPIVNTPRDFMFTVTFSDQYSGFVPKAMIQVAKDVVKSIKEIRNSDSEIVKKYFEYGGAMDFLSSQGKLKKESLLGQLIDKAVSPNSKDIAKSVFSKLTLHKISAYSEVMFRLGIFQRSIQNQLKDLGFDDISQVTDKQQLDDIYNNAVANARGILDFNQGGYITKDLESVIPYINVAFQGGRVALSTLEKDPVKTTSKILQVATMASAVPIGISLALISANKEDDDDDKSVYDIYLNAMSGISLYQKSKYMNIVTGKKNEDGEYQVLKIAKAQELSPVISITDDIYTNVIRKVAGKEKKSGSRITEDALFTFNSNVSPFDLTSPQGFFTRTPAAKATLTYATGYDFFREQPLSNDIGKVPKSVEGINMKSTEDFYKKLGEKYGLSPVRSKAFVESLITSPNTNPFVGVLYGGADAVSSDKDLKSIGKDLFKTIYKSTGKRVVSYSSDFNRKLETREDLEDKLDKIKAENYRQKAEFNKLAKDYINKEISRDELNSKLQELEPNERKRLINKIKDKIKLKNVDSNILDIKYEQDAQAKALMIMYHYGNIFDGSDDSNNIYRQMKRAGGILTPQVKLEYGKLLKSE